MTMMKMMIIMIILTAQNNDNDVDKKAHNFNKNNVYYVDGGCHRDRGENKI